MKVKASEGRHPRTQKRGRGVRKGKGLIEHGLPDGTQSGSQGAGIKTSEFTTQEGDPLRAQARQVRWSGR